MIFKTISVLVALPLIYPHQDYDEQFYKLKLEYLEQVYNLGLKYSATNEQPSDAGDYRPTSNTTITKGKQHVGNCFNSCSWVFCRVWYLRLYNSWRRNGRFSGGEPSVWEPKLDRIGNRSRKKWERFSEDNEHI